MHCFDVFRRSNLSTCPTQSACCKSSPQQLAPLMKAASGKGIKNQYIVVLKQPATIMSNDLQAFQQFTQRSVNALANKHALEIKNVLIVR